MPPRARVDKRRELLKLTPGLDLLLCLGPREGIDDTVTDEELAEAWAVHGQRLTERAEGMGRLGAMRAFWRFTEGVPDHLRPGHDHLRPGRLRIDWPDDADEFTRAYEAMKAQERRVELERTGWLSRNGQAVAH